MENKKGRKTIQENLRMHEQFQELYLRGYSPFHAAKKLGTDKKTAYDHYHKIQEEFSNYNNKDFFETANTMLEQTIICYDSILDEYMETLDYQKNRIASYEVNNEKAPNELVQTKTSILRDIRNVLKERAQLVLQKPFEKSVEIKVEEKMTQYD